MSAAAPSGSVQNGIPSVGRRNGTLRSAVGIVFALSICLVSVAPFFVIHTRASSKRQAEREPQFKTAAHFAPSSKATHVQSEREERRQRDEGEHMRRRTGNRNGGEQRKPGKGTPAKQRSAELKGRPTNSPQRQQTLPKNIADKVGGASYETGDAASGEDTSSGLHGRAAEEKPMNILLFYADDWRHDTLSIAGNPVVKTPILDGLARKGVRFTHNCVTTSVCWVSRATLYTGQYLARHKTSDVNVWNGNFSESPYALLKRGGYHVGHVGKWGISLRFDKGIDFEVEEENWHFAWRSTKNGPRLWHITEKNQHNALQFLSRRPRDKPFFLNVAYFATHAVDNDPRQYLPQNSSMGLYVNDTVPVGPSMSDDSWRRMPPFFTEKNEGRNRWRIRHSASDLHQHMMKNYYRMATEVDTACGKILEEVERQGELNNTLVLFTTDNGNFHGEHGLADKWFPHQESIRVPLIIMDPRIVRSKVGTTNGDFTLNIDLAPTILAAAGITTPSSYMGRDISVLYREAGKKEAVSAQPHADWLGEMHDERLLRTPWRTDFFYEHPVIKRKEYIPSSEALVQKDYKYLFWPDFGTEQLFDLKADPIEDNDLVESTTREHVEKLIEMRTRFAELKQLAHSPGKVTL